MVSWPALTRLRCDFAHDPLAFVCVLAVWLEPPQPATVASAAASATRLRRRIPLDRSTEASVSPPPRPEAALTLYENITFPVRGLDARSSEIPGSHVRFAQPRRMSMTVRSAFALAAALITVVVLGLSAAAPGSAAAGPATSLSNDIVQNLNLATLHGAVPSTKKVTVGIFLSNPNQAAEDRFVAELYDPNSANYHQFLTPDAFNTRFGVPAAKFQAAEAWAQGRGLTVKPVEVSHDYFLATGTAAQVEAAFHTPLNRYTDPVSGRNFYSNTQIPTVPASLGISDVFGLNNFNRLMTPITPQPAAATNTTGPAPSDATTAHTGLLSVKELWSIYDAPPTNAGNGASMAIIGWGVTTPVIPDLRSFEAE